MQTANSPWMAVTCWFRPVAIAAVIVVMVNVAGCAQQQPASAADAQAAPGAAERDGSEPPLPQKTVGTTGPVADTTSAARVVEESWDNGNIRLRKHVITGKDGEAIEHGQFTRWYPNGQKEYEATMEFGLKEGVTTRWHENGQVWQKQHYRKGLRDGRTEVWTPAGNLVKVEEHEEGQPHGVWLTYGKDGNIKYRHVYDHGVPMPSEDDGKTPPEVAPVTR